MVRQGGKLRGEGADYEANGNSQIETNEEMGKKYFYGEREREVKNKRRAQS